MNYEDIAQEMAEVEEQKAQAQYEEADRRAAEVSEKFRELELDTIVSGAPQSFAETQSFADYFHGTGAASLALRAAGLHYPLRMVPLCLTGGEYSDNVGQFHAIVNEKGHVLGRPVTSRYHMAQNATVAAMMDELCEGLGEKDVKICQWNGGERLAIRVPVKMGIEDYTPEELEIVKARRTMFNTVHNWVDSAKHPDLVPPLDAHITLHSAHGTLGKILACMELRFTACDNGVIDDLIREGFSFRHSAKMEERIREAQRALVLARGNAKVWRDLVATLFGKPMNATQFSQYLDTMFPMPVEAGKARTFCEQDRAEFEKIYQQAPGAAPGTLFGAMQAATYWNTHAAGVKVGPQLKKYKLGDDARVELEETARYGLLLHGRARDFQAQAVQQLVTWLD